MSTCAGQADEVFAKLVPQLLPPSATHDSASSVQSTSSATTTTSSPATNQQSEMLAQLTELLRHHIDNPNPDAAKEITALFAALSNSPNAHGDETVNNAQLNVRPKSKSSLNQGSIQFLHYCKMCECSLLDFGVLGIN